MKERERWTTERNGKKRERARNRREREGVWMREGG